MTNSIVPLYSPPHIPHRFFTEKKRIEAWLIEQKIFNFKIDDKLHVHVENSVDIKDKNLTHFPVQFGVVGGVFNCQKLSLQSLYGAPHTVGTDFECSHNQLTSLEGGPQNVGRKFDCSHNRLTTLAHGPIKAQSYYCHQNKLVDLRGAPATLEMFNCDRNELKSLKGGPVRVEIFYHCANNQLRNFEGAPEHVGKHLFAQRNDIEELSHHFSFIKSVILGKQSNGLWTEFQNEVGDIEFTKDAFNTRHEKEMLMKEFHLVSPLHAVEHKKIIKI